MTVKLTIDSRCVEVEEGATILEAARKLGIEIPTLCHLDALPPVSSCFMCVVRVDNRPNLVPSCVAPAEDGMVVTATSDEILAARKTALELLLSDHVGDCVAPCTLACPAGMDIPAVIRHIRNGRFAEALTVIRRRISLPGVLGRICPRFCERVCRRGDLDEPIAICALKRFPADAVDLGAGALSKTQPTGKRVAVLGAGPAGLSAAFYLLQEGHACTVYDAHPEPGGTLRYSIPEFRLSCEALDRDIAAIRQLGVEFRLNTRIDDEATPVRFGNNMMPSSWRWAPGARRRWIAGTYNRRLPHLSSCTTWLPDDVRR
ncbi:MAG: FAD-dependent oxidoreductase [Pseudomonadota bacterium]